MAELGNAWHLPLSPEPRGHAGMRDPVGAVVPGAEVTILSGNQFRGDGNPGNQLQAGSSVFFRRRSDAGWTSAPLLFASTADNNKYFAATLAADTLAVGDVVQYYLRVAYDDHATTFVHAAGATSATTADEAAAQATPFTFPVESSAQKGLWGPVFPLPNVAVHAHLLPDGRVLMWGRRDRADQSLDVHECTPFVWDPATGNVQDTPKPTMADGTPVNLFCSGHSFLPDGRLLVVGGHWKDSQGLDQAALYDHRTNTWSATSVMNHGRWYPTATTLVDGGVLVLSGQYLANGQILPNMVPQVWRDGSWAELASLPDGSSFDLYPRMHAHTGDSVLMSGPRAQGWWLDPRGRGRWTRGAVRNNGLRDYAPSVEYVPGKFLYIGGGNDPGTHEPTAAVRTMDVHAAAPQWAEAAPMHTGRRQHNATLLPDGTVLVTGGTSGGDGPDVAAPGFNDLTPGRPVHTTELWDPANRQWTELTAERVDRCYHSTTVLLPDGRVLSAGGGEYRPVSGVDQENDPADSHRDAQVFSPPYLFAGARPEITSAPGAVDYGQTFEVTCPDVAAVTRVSLLAPSSVTHGTNMHQRIVFLAREVRGGTLGVTAPASPDDCPPGFYMLFLLNEQGVPSRARFIQLTAPARRAVPTREADGPRAAVQAHAEAPREDALTLRAAVREATRGIPTVVGILSTCPYGIGACWGAAHEALLSLEGVGGVDPIPDAEASTATVFFEGEALPPLERWLEQFGAMVNGSYRIRGFEVSLDGAVQSRQNGLYLVPAGHRPAVRLVPLTAGQKIQWDRRAAAPRAVEPDEEAAFAALSETVEAPGTGGRIRLTGPLTWEGEYLLHVRLFDVVAAEA
jgi:galactose oxidase